MSIFDCLRGHVLRGLGLENNQIARRMDVIPIEGTVDGWYCLRSDGVVVHVDERGGTEEVMEPPRRAIAMIGSLVRRFPLASHFLPSGGPAFVCPDCGGSGTILSLPPELASRVVCGCGGLGWVAGSPP